MRALTVFVTLLASLGFPRAQSGATTEADRLANEFLDSLPADLRKSASFQFDDDYRKTWNFVPIERRGVSLAQMSSEQTAKAFKLLRSSLSDSGFKKVESIRGLEEVLFEMEGRNPTRDKMKYYFSFFGEPKPEGHWGWRYEGHHLSLNFTYRDDRLIASTPQFLGTNPAEVSSGPHRGRVLSDEQDVAFALLNSLDTTQRAKAVVATTDPGEIVTSNRRQVEILNRTGIEFGDLRPDQQELLLRLVRVYVNVQSAQEQKRRMTRVEPKSLIFAWMGALKPGSGHYYRIQGSKFLVEYDNSQNNANHVHSVWRDFNGDFGEDVLAEHYASDPHSHGSTAHK